MAIAKGRAVARQAQASASHGAAEKWVVFFGRSAKSGGRGRRGGEAVAGRTPARRADTRNEETDDYREAVCFLNGHGHMVVSVGVWC